MSSMRFRPPAAVAAVSTLVALVLLAAPPAGAQHGEPPEQGTAAPPPATGPQAALIAGLSETGPEGADGELLAAAKRGDAEAVAAALEAGASPATVAPNGDTALHLAAVGGSVEALERLLAAGADPRARGAMGTTPLHLVGRGRANRSGHEIAVRLLGAGAEIEARDDQGRTPLHSAAFDGDPAVVELLIERGAAVEVEDAEGNRPLHLAIQAVLLIDRVAQQMNRADVGQANREVVERLLDHDADPNAGDQAGMTPLHQAARYGHRMLVERLIAAGADPAVKDAGGRSAADYAFEHPAIAELLAPRAEAAANGGGSSR